MDETKFFHWRMQLDRDATARAYAGAPGLDPSCCSACAVFLAASERALLPSAVVELLEAAGADQRKPQEVWGAPDQGFINLWWVFAGHLLTEDWAGEGRDAFVEPAPGFRCWIGSSSEASGASGAEARPQLKLECEWESGALATLEQSVWPPPGAPAGAA